ncbi:enoyl-CoA hydratase/isomerase family protein [Streptomyces endophyticus]|uniref:Enoyl-CoA hydratase/isomerase family protein n=1 Tax=Streptomyces endophyticus TaxID=714166 RepID=A0ABU6FBK1_9ACTN|nr:enoyl-CoA hydratase/isomerase family protein [Streptomyces endophyticus]MEB8341405.1 enoyl-CoA hydratase/isomerase family protein [Streptomyces endophyticus]
MDTPWQLVDLDNDFSRAPHDRPGPERASFDTRPRVVIGCAARPVDVPAEAYDVLLTGIEDAPRPWVSCPDPRETATRLCEAVTASPDASITLVQVLRLGRNLDIPERLVAESLAYSALQGGATFRHWLATTPRGTARPAAQPVRLDREGDRLIVTLDRPWVRNAVDAATRDALCEALTVAVVDPSVTRVDLRGSGPAFCSGGDLTEFGTSGDPARAHRVRVEHSPAALLARCAGRATAHLHGACVGAGIELASFAGRVVAAPDTRIRLPEVAMGLIPGAGGTAGIPRRIGRHRATHLALSGAELTACEAQDWGLVDEVTGTV